MNGSRPGALRDDPDVRWLARLLWSGAGLVALMWLVMLGVIL